MTNLNLNQISRIEDFFKRKSNILTQSFSNTTYTITPIFYDNLLKQIIITKHSQKNFFGWNAYLDKYTYTLQNKELHSEHVPNNPNKEMQEKYILEVIEELLAIVDYISNNPE